MLAEGRRILEHWHWGVSHVTGTPGTRKTNDPLAIAASISQNGRTDPLAPWTLGYRFRQSTPHTRWPLSPGTRHKLWRSQMSG